MKSKAVNPRVFALFATFSLFGLFAIPTRDLHGPGCLGYPLGQLSIKIENVKGEVKMSPQGSVEYGKATSNSATTQFFELSGKRNDSKYLAAVSVEVE